MSRKICVITSGRADYGLLRGVMRGINNDSDLKLQVIAAGSHLSMGLGATYTTIEADGFVIDKKVPSITGDDSSLGIAQSMGLAIAGFADALASLSPDIVLVLGDRYEIFSAVAAALVARMPVAHILVDKQINHSNEYDAIVSIGAVHEHPSIVKKNCG